MSLFVSQSAPAPEAVAENVKTVVGELGEISASLYQYVTYDMIYVNVEVDHFELPKFDERFADCEPIVLCYRVNRDETIVMSRL